MFLKCKNLPYSFESISSSSVLGEDKLSHHKDHFFDFRSESSSNVVFLTGLNADTDAPNFFTIILVEHLFGVLILVTAK